MKTIRFFGIEINISFSVYLTKSIKYDLPNNADNIRLTNINNIWSLEYNEINRQHIYRLLTCKKAEIKYITPLLNKNMEYNNNRVVIVKLYN